MDHVTKIDDGGPAFARPGFYHDGCTAEKDCLPTEGMSLRDWFAGQALSAMIVVNEKVTTGKHIPYSIGVKATAEACYEIADAMIAARKGAQ